MTRAALLAQELVARATEKGLTLGTAESLTAGLIASTIAGVPGASRALLGGVVSYDPEVKHALLRVSRAVIDGVGVVSDPCARQMALGARAALHADIAVSATGVAGPAGGTPETPVGTVFLGLATEDGVRVTRCRFRGGRQTVRRRAAEEALALLLQAVEAARGHQIAIESK